MADDTRLGANFAIDITNLKAGLAQANRMIRESESEFKAAAAGLDDWSSSAEGVSAKIKQLNTTTDLQHKKVDALKKQYEKLISDGLDPASKEAVELRTKINQEQAALSKNEKELEKQTEALEKLGDESGEAAKDTEKLKDSTEKTGKGFSALKGAAAIGVAAIAAVGAAAIAGVKSLLDLAESTRELRTDMAKLETSFETNGLKAEDATETYKTLYGVLGDTGRATEAASHLSLLANNAEDLSKWTDIATGVYAQFGDSLPIEGLTEAANETAKVGDVTGVLADALNWAGVNEEDFQKKLDDCSSEQERQQLITETLNELYSDQADKFKELNKDVIDANEAAADLAQAQADLGAAAEPLNTKITNLKTNILTGLTPAFTTLLGSITDVFNGVEGAPEKLIATIGTFLENTLAKITEYLPKVAEFSMQLIFTIVNTIIEQLPQITETAITLLTTFINSLADMLPELIPTVINAVLLIAETLIDNVDKIIDAGINLILGLADGLIKALPDLVDKIPVIIEKLIDAFINNLPKMLSTGVELLLSVQKGLMDAIPKLVSKLPQIIAQIVKGLITDGIPSLIKAGGDLLAGLFEGLLNFDWIWSKIKELGNGILDGIKSIFGISSPSKVFKDEIGAFLGEGMAIGLEDGFDKNIRGIKKSIVKSMNGISTDIPLNVNGAGNPNSSGVVVNQYNTFSNSRGSRYEIYKTKQSTAAAVRLAVGGVS